MRNIYRYFAYSSMLFIIFSSVLFFLHINNKTLHKLEKTFKYKNINHINIDRYFKIIDRFYYQPLHYNEFFEVRDDGKLISKIFGSTNLNYKFEILNNEFIEILRSGLNKHQNDLINNTEIRFRNVVKTSSINYLRQNLNTKINIYDLDTVSLNKNLEDIIIKANKNFYNKLYKSTLQHVNSTIENIEFYELMSATDADYINDFFQNVIPNKSDSLNFMQESALFDIHKQKSKIFLSKKYAMNAKNELNNFFDNLKDDNKNFFINYNNENIIFDAKYKYDLRIYFIFILLLAIILPLFIHLIFQQLRKIKF